MCEGILVCKMLKSKWRIMLLIVSIYIYIYEKPLHISEMYDLKKVYINTMYNLNCVIVIVFHCTYAYARGYIQVLLNCKAFGNKAFFTIQYLWRLLYFWTIFIRTYMIHLLGTYVTILCNWLIFWQNAFYLYLGRTRMCLILQETLFQDQVLKACKSVQDSSLKSVCH